MTSDGTSRSLDWQGVRIHYHDIGRGPALLLIHGGGPGATGWSNWNRNIGALSQQFRVIVPDLPGFGRSSERPRGSPFPGWWAGPMLGLLDALDIRKANFIGNSLGTV